MLFSFFFCPHRTSCDNQRGPLSPGWRAAVGAVLGRDTGSGRRASAAVAFGLHVRAVGRRERRRERRWPARGPAQEARQRDCNAIGRPREKIVAGPGAGHGRGHRGSATRTRPGGQMVLPAQPVAARAQRREGHHRRQRTGVPVDGRRWARHQRSARPVDRPRGRRVVWNAANRQYTAAPGHPGGPAHLRAHRRVQVSGGRLESWTPVHLAPDGRVQ